VHLLRCMDLNSILTSDKGALPYQSAHTRIHTASLLCLACSSDPSPCADPLKGIDFGANFDDEEKEPAAESQADLIHIRVQQRNGRKCITTCQGLNDQLDLKKILKAIKKVHCCNGCIVEDEEMGQVLQFQGDQRDAVMTFLVENELAEKGKIKKHGHG